MVKKFDLIDGKERQMLPLEFAHEKNISDVIIAGAFNNKLDTKITSKEFDKIVEEYLNQKADGGN